MARCLGWWNIIIIIIISTFIYHLQYMYKSYIYIDIFIYIIQFMNHSLFVLYSRCIFFVPRQNQCPSQGRQGGNPDIVIGLTSLWPDDSSYDDVFDKAVSLLFQRFFQWDHCVYPSQSTNPYTYYIYIYIYIYIYTHSLWINLRMYKYIFIV